MSEDVEKNADLYRPSRHSGDKRSTLEIEDEECTDLNHAAQASKVNTKSSVTNNAPEGFAAVVEELKAVIIDAKRLSTEKLSEKVKEEESSEIVSLPAPPSMSSSSSSNKTLAVKKPSLIRKTSDSTRNKCNQDANFHGFEKLKEAKSVSMSLDWVNFRIKSESGEELFQAVQSRYCSLSVTGRNELFVRRTNAENVLRIHSSVAEDVRNFNFYTSSEKHVGVVACNVRQNFKVPSTIKNRITGKSYNVSVQHEGESKFWQVDDAGAETTVASVKVRVGHRWQSIYTLTFIQETSLSSQVLLVGFLLALASARLESEVVPAFFAFSAVLLTFIIFAIIQFT